MQPQVKVRIQHHPSRIGLIPELLRRLHPLSFEVMEHSSDPPSPWAGYKLCMENPPDCTHLLIVQDDVQPVPNFVPALEQIADANPDTPVCFFFPPYGREKKAYMEAQRAGRSYVTLATSSQSFMPLIAVLWPLHKLREFAEWAETNHGLPGQREPRSDDAMAGWWKVRTRQQVRLTVPSLVEHLGYERSVCGNDRKGFRFAMALAEDALDYDWS